MYSRILAVPVTAAVLAAGVTYGAGAAAGAGRAATTVTIKAEGTDLSGTVASPKPAKCAEGRKVIVMKQIGARGGGDDEFFASDNASKNGSRYEWSTGNTGVEGKFYAKVRRTPSCKGDTSPTIRATRPD